MKKPGVLILLTFAFACGNDLPGNSDKVETVLYVGEGDNQPLVVGLLTYYGGVLFYFLCGLYPLPWS